MATFARSDRITVVVPDHVTLEELEPAAPRPRGTRRSIPKGPVPMPGPGGAGAGAGPAPDDPIVAALQAQELDLANAFALTTGRAPTRRAAAAPWRLTFDVDETEDAVALVEQDGVYAWRYPLGTEPVRPAATHRGPRVERPRRRVTFDIAVEPAPDAGARRTRGPAADFVFGKVKVFVFRFVARLAMGPAIGFLERRKRTGLVHLAGDEPASWRPIERLADVPMAVEGRTARILLLVHGTFSSTVGSYGALGVTAAGRAFLARARERYDAVIGYDHRTLSVDPRANAVDLLARLEHTTAAGLDIDAVAFSRGGLVLRSLIEYLLPAASLRARVLRAVFVGATNGGTRLASSENWSRLVDLTTNLVSVGSRAVALVAPAAPVALMVREAMDTLGALVKVLVTQALRDDDVPGLAAMVPDGAFVTDLNRFQPGQPGAAESLYYAITTDFDVNGVAGGQGAPEFPARLARWAVDALADSVMREPNDLVVHTSSMTEVDPEFGAFIKDSLRFGRNPHVYHTNYFTRDEVPRALGRWFGLDPAAAPDAPTLPANADDRIAIVSADEPLDAALRTIRGGAARFVVARREMPWGETFHYAYRTDELEAVARRLGARIRGRTIERALEATELEMHESSATPETPLEGVESATMRQGPSGRRVLIRDGDVLRGVVERAIAAATTREFAASPRFEAHGIPAEASAPPRRTRGAPTRSRETSAVAAAAAERGARSTLATPLPPVQGTIYASADMPEQVELDTAVPLSVVVSSGELAIEAGPTRAKTKVKVALDRRLVVMVVAKSNLKVIGDDRADVDPKEPRTELLFEVQGTHLGAGEVWVLLRQGPLVLATLRLRPTVVASGADVTGTRAREGATAAPADPGTRPYPVLEIYEERTGDQLVYHFALHLGAADFLSHRSQPLKTDRAAYVDRLYQDIEARWLSTRGDFDAFQDELRALGGTLFDELVPVAIQEKLWELRDSLQAIQVVAEEPFIPWELLHLKRPRAASGAPAPLGKETHFLAQKGLVRWLHNRGPAPLSLAIEKGRSHFLIPDYPHPDWALPHAQQEATYLKRAFGSVEVPATVTALRTLLGTPGQVDHFHFSGHGEAETAQAVNAQLVLSGTVADGQWVPRYVKADFVAQLAQLRVPDRPGPLVMLNACQVGRAGWRLSSIGGFAESFIRAGAGAFVGSLWSVGDQPAADFSKAFYDALKRGEPLARCAVLGREAAAARREGSWLAYVVYGYPHATLRQARGR